MSVTYGEFYYNYKVDGDFVTWLNDKAKPPDNWELLILLPYGSPFVAGKREGHTGEVAMRCVCYFKKLTP